MSGSFFLNSLPRPDCAFTLQVTRVAWVAVESQGQWDCQRKSAAHDALHDMCVTGLDRHTHGNCLLWLTDD